MRANKDNYMAYPLIRKSLLHDLSSVLDPYCICAEWLVVTNTFYSLEMKHNRSDWFRIGHKYFQDDNHYHEHYSNACIQPGWPSLQRLELKFGGRTGWSISRTPQN